MPPACRNSLAAEDGCQSALLHGNRPSSTEDDDVIQAVDYRSHMRTQSAGDWNRKKRSLSSDATMRAQSQQRSDVEQADDEDDDDDGHADDAEMTLAGALEMLPIPCAISGPPGLPAILLVNPPAHAPQSVGAADGETANGNVSKTTVATSTAAAAATTTTTSVSGSDGGVGGGEIRSTTESSSGTVLDRWSVTKLNYFYARYLPTKRRDRTGAWRERKATKTLAIVLGVFLVCWAPFFTINIINAVCIRQTACESTPLVNDGAVLPSAASAAADAESSATHPFHRRQDERGTPFAEASTTSCSDACHVNPVVMSSFVWLGYINSALNPVIYTIFNVEFRRAFDRLLRRPCRALMSSSASATRGGSASIAFRGMITASAAKR